MKINGTIYESYLSFKPSEDDESVEKISDAKWYNLAMKNKTIESKKVLDNCFKLKNTRAEVYMNKFFEVIETNMDSPIELLIEKSRCNFYDIALDAICEVMDKKRNEYLLPYEEVMEMCDDYVDYVDEWTRLVWLEHFGPELTKERTLKDCQYLKDIIEDMSYYSSVRSNPTLENINESKLTLKKLIKWGKKNKIDLDVEDKLASYVYDVDCYLSALSSIYSKDKKKNTRR